MAATKRDTPEPALGVRSPPVRRAASAFASTRSLSRRELLQAPVCWPRPSRLQAPLKPASKRIAAGMEALGVRTVGELLEHLPTDSRQARTVAALRVAQPATVSVQVRSITKRAVRRRGMRPLVEASVFDSTATMRATFFNQPWLLERYPPGTRLLLHGTADGRGGFRVSHHAVAAGAAGDGGGGAATAADESDAVAHYPAAEGVTSTQILTLVRAARPALGDVPETLPAATRVSEGLPDRASALAAMHFPRDAEDLELGRRRLAYEELLVAQLVFLRRRAARRTLAGAAPLDGEPKLSERWLRGALPFTPTADQLRAIETIAGELARRRPMQRLLMGEVGSGKTVVALYAMLRAVEHGHQAALMAPTETLAEQHFATLQRLLGAEPLAVALLTGSTPAVRRRDIVGKLGSGELSLIVGTHALIEPDVRFASLAVAVIDEQHRFGVHQREALQNAGTGSPHILHMTATPIPRTLALARYGDLDTSALRELPLGRRPVETKLVAGDSARERAYERLRAELDAGRQAYVVCPLIEEAETAPAGEQPQAPAGAGAGRPGVRAAVAELQRLRGEE
ncbi:MAG TPA: DEAD/DEAH box helicase, partial [Solirubrobacteraceae bacterium]|nr:DEAD/DEAH box helicase [Solirubrobacteraceae bacterium]